MTGVTAWRASAGTRAAAPNHRGLVSTSRAAAAAWSRAGGVWGATRAAPPQVLLQVWVRAARPVSGGCTGLARAGIRGRGDPLSLSLPVKMTGAPATQPRRWWHGQNGDTCRAAGGFLAGRSGAAQSQEAARVAVGALALQSCRCPRAKGASGHGWRVELSPQRCSQQLSGCLVPGGTGEGPAGGWSLGQRAPRRSSRPPPHTLRGNQAQCGFV